MVQDQLAIKHSCLLTAPSQPPVELGWESKVKLTSWEKNSLKTEKLLKNKTKKTNKKWNNPLPPCLKIIKKPVIKSRIYDTTAHYFALHCQAPSSNLYRPPFWVTTPVYILGMTFYGVEYLFGQFGSFELTTITPSFFGVPTYCQGMRHWVSAWLNINTT